MRVRVLSIAVVIVGLLLPTRLEGQGYRGRATTYVSFVQFRELAMDSVPSAGVPGEGVRRLLPDGTRVRCYGAQCWFYRSGDVVDVAPLIQDVELSVWPGIPGLRGYTHMRARQSLGAGELWPRSGRRLEALAAYLEYSRPGLRARGGRLWRTSGLGFYNLDGADLLVHLPAGLRLEGYAGLSLLRGLDERPTGDLLAAIEPFPPNEDAYLFGIQAQWRPFPFAAGSMVYQRELRTDRAGLYSERIAADARVLVERATLNLELEYDVATGSTNEARARVSVPVGPRWIGSAEVRRYYPYFDLWTIWGAFSPVGFDEARLEVSWSSGVRAVARVAGAYRRYDNTGAGTTFIPIQDDGWRLDAEGRIELFAGWTASGAYRLEDGFGASRSSADLALQRAVGTGGYLGLSAASFQRISEFQVGEGIVFAVGADAAARVRQATIRGGAMVYRHRWSERPAFMNWNQVRAHASLEIPIGPEPGAARRVSP
ncbi:MAG: hypothetical protein HY704_08755 [Gemmatimonadetes bacterium]|nr:hypothetical protein [Gemmatimonadota bacterium]